MKFDLNRNPSPIVNNCKISIPEVALRFQKYHAANPSWGSLHIVLDDLNLRDESVIYCMFTAQANGDDEGFELGSILLKMSKTQRKKIARF